MLDFYQLKVLVKVKFMEVKIMATLKRSKKTVQITPMFSQEDYQKMGEEYLEVSSQIKELEAKKKTLSDKIKEGAETYGVKDDKGSYYCDTDTCIFGKVAKKSMKLNQDKAVETLESMGLGDLVDVITVKTVNEDRLTSAVQSGRITLEEVEEFTDTNTTYSVSVKAKEVVTAEVEQSTLKVARKK
jgi:hypothetical protein